MKHGNPNVREQPKSDTGDLTRDLTVLSRDFAVKKSDLRASRRPQNQSNLLQISEQVIKDTIKT